MKSIWLAGKPSHAFMTLSAKKLWTMTWPLFLLASSWRGFSSSSCYCTALLSADVTNCQRPPPNICQTCGLRQLLTALRQPVIRSLKRHFCTKRSKCTVISCRWSLFESKNRVRYESICDVLTGRDKHTGAAKLPNVLLQQFRKRAV